jgi:DNA replication licensing factor MCM4
MKAANLAAATDPRTGRIDMNMITTGFTESSRDLRMRIEEALERVLSEDGHTNRFDVLRQRVLNRLSEGENPVNPDDRSTASAIDQVCREAISVGRRA